MKKISLSHALLFIVMFLLIAGCSKDTQLPVTYAKAVKMTNEPPVPNTGTIKGFTSPVSLDAIFVLDNHQGLSYKGKVNTDGSILMDNITEGIYQMNITYLTGRVDYSVYAVFVIDRIEVAAGTVTALGEIRLPWIF